MSFMGIPDRLREFRLSRNLSQAEFASSLGTKQAYIQRYETGTKIPDTFLCSLIKVFAIDINWLLTGEVLSLSSSLEDESLDSRQTIPLISHVAAGELFAEDIPFDDRQSIPSLPGLVPGDCYALEVQGNSMEPVISEGDILVVTELSPSEKIYIGLDYVVVTESGPMVKTLYYDLDDENHCKMRLVSYNRSHPDIYPQNVFRIFRIVRHIKQYKVPEELDKTRRLEAASLSEFGCFKQRRYR